MKIYENKIEELHKKYKQDISLDEISKYLNENIKKVEKDDICIAVIPTDFHKEEIDIHTSKIYSYKINHKYFREEIINCNN